MKNVTLTEFAEKAKTGGYIGIAYNVLDCQAFVERVLIDCGVRKSNGTVYDYKGSNSMWRNALSWKGTIAEAVAKYGELPVGFWLFTVKNDGGEVERGYHDNEGNAAHVGIYLGNGKAIHSTTGGVQLCDFPAARWTHCGLPKMLTFTTGTTPANTNTPTPTDTNADAIRARLDQINELCLQIRALL